MITLKFLHAGDEGVAAFDGLGVVARSTETTDRTVTLHTNHTLRHGDFFTGFGKFRRIVLFDTLIAKHTTQELVSVLAHEMGHYKKGHIHKFMIMSFLNTIIIFFLLSLFIGNEGLFAAFKMQYISVYGALIFFGFLYTPISMFLSVIQNIISRKYEYEADRYSVTTYKNPKAMIEALKKLSVDNLSNLTPHKMKVFMEYSHPTVLDRIKAIKNINIEAQNG